jgi:hypothetical protein
VKDGRKIYGKKSFYHLMVKYPNLWALIFLATVAVAVLSGCIAPPETEAERATQLYIQACLYALDIGQNLSAGPCLLDPIPELPNWVCDVAHSPRQDVDNLRENQCDAWHARTADHFVEVTPECAFIQAY